MIAAADNGELGALRRQYDLCLRLLSLDRHSEPVSLLRGAPELIVEVTGAQQGYLEFHQDEDGPNARWWIGHGFSSAQITDVRRAISQGIIAQALATGQTVTTPSALLDPRFSERTSVRLSHIEAVLCAPIGEDPPCGVLYLQGQSSSALFSDESQARVELFARHLAPRAARLLAQYQQQSCTDPTKSLRETLRLTGVIGRSAYRLQVLPVRAQARLLRDTLEETGWNIIETARKLDLAIARVQPDPRLRTRTRAQVNIKPSRCRPTVIDLCVHAASALTALRTSCRGGVCVPVAGPVCVTLRERFRE